MEHTNKDVEPFASYLTLGITAEKPVSHFIPMFPGASTNSNPGDGVSIIVVGEGSNLCWSSGDIGYISNAPVNEKR